MFNTTHIADRGDKGRKGVAAKPNCIARDACTDDFNPMERAHV